MIEDNQNVTVCDKCVTSENDDDDDYGFNVKLMIDVTVCDK